MLPDMTKRLPKKLMVPAQLLLSHKLSPTCFETVESLFLAMSSKDTIAKACSNVWVNKARQQLERARGQEGRQGREGEWGKINNLYINGAVF